MTRTRGLVRRIENRAYTAALRAAHGEEMKTNRPEGALPSDAEITSYLRRLDHQKQFRVLGRASLALSAIGKKVTKDLEVSE